jgi:hypothetical protein
VYDVYETNFGTLILYPEMKVPVGKLNVPDPFRNVFKTVLKFLHKFLLEALTGKILQTVLASQGLVVSYPWHIFCMYYDPVP